MIANSLYLFIKFLCSFSSGNGSLVIITPSTIGPNTVTNGGKYILADTRSVNRFLRKQSKNFSLPPGPQFSDWPTCMVFKMGFFTNAQSDNAEPLIRMAF